MTLKVAFVGTDAAGTAQRIEQTVPLGAASPRKSAEAPATRIVLANLTAIDVEAAQFEGTPPAPTPEGQPGNPAYLQKRLTAAKEQLKAAQDALSDAQEQEAAAAQQQSLANSRQGQPGGSEGVLTSAAGGLEAARERTAQAREQVTLTQKQVDALEKQLNGVASSGAPAAPAAAAPAAAGKPLSAQQINDLIDTAKKSAAAGEWAKASDALQQVLAGGGARLKDDDRARLNASLGSALANQAKYPEAEAALREAIRLDPQNPRYQDTLGLVLENDRKYAEAEAAFQQAVHLAPDNADYKAHLKDAQDHQKS